jgi:DNA-binding MarR family transcriptional regulator
MPDEASGRRPTPTEGDVDAVLVWTAIRVGRRLERMVTDRLAGHGLTPVQFGVLVYLGARPGMNQSEVARAVQIRPQSAREVVTAMIDRGLLHRSGPEGRGRRSAMQLTEDGHALLARTWPVVAGIDAAAVGLTPGDDVRLNRLLQAVLNAPDDTRAGLNSPGAPAPG